jgi:hypothetical protein
MTSCAVAQNYNIKILIKFVAAFDAVWLRRVARPAGVRSPDGGPTTFQLIAPNCAFLLASRGTKKKLFTNTWPVGA